MNTAFHEAEPALQDTPARTMQRPVRYAVVGAGWISQAAFLPGVAHSGNSVVTALVTGDATKANEAVARNGGQVTEVSTLPADESVAAPSNQLAAGDQAPTNR